MGMWIFAAVLGAIVMGFSPVSAFAVGAIAMAVLGYCLSRQRSLIRMGVTFCLVTFSHSLIGRVNPIFLEKGLTGLEMDIMRCLSSDWLIMAIAAAVMVSSFMIGIVHRTPSS